MKRLKVDIFAWARRLTILGLAAVCLSTSAWAADKDDEKEGPPDPETISLETKDGVVLKATWWAPEEPGKDTVPIILLHGWEGRRQEYDRLASGLQKLGHAVIVPDLRGHGASTTQKQPGRGEDKIIDPQRMTRNDFAAMITQDMEAVKKFLMEKNNAGELNIELLCVVGADMGSVIALNWAAQDWNARRLPSYKQGQDVKALVLLSPSMSFKGLPIQLALQQPIVRSKVSTLIAVGAGERTSFADAKRLHTSLEKYHAKVDEDAPAEEKAKKKDLFFMSPDTPLQGTKLLTVGGLKVDAAIAQFIKYRLTDKKDEFSWTDRTPPF